MVAAVSNYIGIVTNITWWQWLETNSVVSVAAVLEHGSVGTQRCRNTTGSGTTITSLGLVLCKVTKRETLSVWLQDRHFCLHGILTLRDRRSGRNGFASLNDSGMLLTLMRRANKSRLAPLFMQWGRKWRIYNDLSD